MAREGLFRVQTTRRRMAALAAREAEVFHDGLEIGREMAVEGIHKIKSKILNHKSKTSALFVIWSLRF